MRPKFLLERNDYEKLMEHEFSDDVFRSGFNIPIARAERFDREYFTERKKIDATNQLEMGKKTIEEQKEVEKERSGRLLSGHEDFVTDKISITDRNHLEKILNRNLMTRVSNNSKEVPFSFTIWKESEAGLKGAEQPNTTQDELPDDAKKQGRPVAYGLPQGHATIEASNGLELAVSPTPKRRRMLEKAYTCAECDKKFDKQLALIKHLEDEAYNRFFTDRYNLRAEDGPQEDNQCEFPCPQCTKPFSAKIDLEYHSLEDCRLYLTSKYKLKVNPNAPDFFDI